MPLLSILDQSPIKSGGTAAAAIQETLELAAIADRLGYHRYWLAEHHATAGLAGSSPEILIGRVAGCTHGIRVGSGGVMLSHYSPLKVAENFRMLETLFPGRIDLGIGRAPGSDRQTARILAHEPGDLDADRFPEKIGDLLGFLRNSFAPGHPFRGLRAMPDGPGNPEVWLLGSSDQSAILAARHGTAFAFAHFINSDGFAEVLQSYRRTFRPSPLRDAPRAGLAVFVICADSEAEALRLATSRDLFVARLYTGRSGPYPSVEEAATYPYSDHERAIIRGARSRSIVGTPEQVRERLLELAGQAGADEWVILTITHDFKARIRSYELLAQAFGLTPRTPAGAEVQETRRRDEG
jgi:luciferase family oxidoreductase group 1